MQEKDNGFQFDQLREIEESKATPLLFEEAKSFLESHKWCKHVLKGWHDENLSILDKLGVFLFEIEPINETIDQHVWVILGDIPTVYLDASVKTAKEALEIYCDLMTEWADNILQEKSLEECYPVEAEPSEENAELLKKRIAFIKRELLLEEN
jgi:hypothetical protein